MKKIGILGSTGSIGIQTLSVINNNIQNFKIEYLTANRNIELLCRQSNIYKPNIICIGDKKNIDFLNRNLSYNPDIYFGRKGLLEISKINNIDVTVNALVGYLGMEPTINAINAGVDIALANKESMVLVGQQINDLLKKNKTKIFPIDSEHSAIWQCIVGEDKKQIKKIILTGSGGPFRTKSLKDFKNIRKVDALNHPNWEMGNKITIDSSTMMNKGLEFIEAHWLFDIAIENIDIIVHPQSIVHSMVEFQDGSIKAQLGLPDMKIPIQYAISYPNHLKTDWPSLDLTKIKTLTFEKPDYEKFPCIKLAYKALKMGGSTPAVLNVANDEAVNAFLNEKINFIEIPKIINNAIEKHSYISNPSIEQIQEIIIKTKNDVNKKIKDS